MTGSLAECPWNELLTLIERLRLTGCLKIQKQMDQGLKAVKDHLFWFENGVLVGAAQANRRNSMTNSLFWLMQYQGWLSYSTATQIAKQCPPSLAIGQYFRQQGVLKSKQLRQLFQMQIMNTLSSLGELEGGQFHLDTEEPLPYERLTGLQLSTYDAIALYRQRKGHPPKGHPPQAMTPDDRAMITIDH